VRLPHTFGTTNPAFDPFYWSGVLTDVAFGDDHAPVQYALDVRLHDGSPLPNANGELPRHNPALYTLARALPLADKGWTLVVRHHDPAVAQRRTEWVAAQLLDLAAPITTTRPYSAAQDDQTVWDAKSVTSGMYLKRNAP
jgi:hypothetical protein